jgi:hypothetical protein
MRARLVKENIGNILKPKTEEEISYYDKKLSNIMTNIFNNFSINGRKDIITDYKFISPVGIIITLEFENDIDIETVEKALSNFEYDDLEVFDNTVNFILPINMLKESIGGGAGYAVYGGGRTFGNPSSGGKFYGRGFGFGSGNTTGGPNIMYTYEVKPLTQNLQQLPTPQDNEEYIHVGSMIKGNPFNSKKEIEGKIISIEKDNDNNIKSYIVIDSKTGQKMDINPTSVYIIKYNDLLSNSIEDNSIVQENYKNFYPNINDFR